MEVRFFKWFDYVRQPDSEVSCSNKWSDREGPSITDLFLGLASQNRPTRYLIEGLVT